MTPRRSSRGRSTQNPPSAPPHTNSSTSTASATKAERNTRAANRTASPQTSLTQRSESMESPENPAPVEPVPPRRSRRGNEQEKENNLKPASGDGEIDPVEEEVTRCICGHAEYPGPSASAREQHPSEEILSDDVGNFFVQCDNCHVWQHGGCMGLTDESMLPDEYYCELCKPEFHKIIRSSNSHKSSRYHPIVEVKTSRSSSLSSASDQPRRKDSSKSKQSESTKRRATMNSRGAYDEDEMLRRAIQESREMGPLGKRTREEIDDLRQMVKRQRTASSSPSSGSKHSQSPPPTGDDQTIRSSVTGGRHSQKLRGAAAKNNRDKEIRDRAKEHSAAQRAEAANKRNARSERRRGEDSPPPTPSLSPSKAVQVTANNKEKTDTSPSGKTNVNRKTGRPLARRGRLGRNQYTRDILQNGDGSDTPMRDASHDRNGNNNNNGNGVSPNGPNGINGESGRSSKAKTHPARTSMNEMKRRVAAILEFVGHMQTERIPQSQASNSSTSSKGLGTPNGSGSSSDLPTASLVRAVEAGLNEMSGHGEMRIAEERDFDQMGSVEMMDTLTKELVQWQSAYGVYSR